MIVLVTGGAASGKSAYAESLAKALPGPHAYVATMRHGDAETEARIARHRAMRAGKGFATIELTDGEGALARFSRRGELQLARSTRDGGRAGARPYEEAKHVPLACAAQGGFPDSANARFRTALLEDLGNLVANGLQGELEDVLSFDNVVIVGNEVGCDGVRYDGLTMGYIEQLGALACRLAARADVVVEVVAGIPNVVKGEVPAGC